MAIKTKIERNRTLTVTKSDMRRVTPNLLKLKESTKVSNIKNKVINQDVFEASQYLPKSFVDLLIVDPPYNLTKSFNKQIFKKKNLTEYADWIDELVQKLIPLLKPTASVYFCSDWFSSTSVHFVLSKYFRVRNRITWEREKGRGSKKNWKQNSEDIWFCTLSDDYTFNVEDIKLKRRVIAPYKDKNGVPKDWDINNKFRLTYPSNIWNDLSVPFWSMPENTEHPTQKPEKLMAKLILASSNKKDFVFDPFLGSGTSAVVAKKLGRNYCGIEIDNKFACLSEVRLSRTNKGDKIQGYSDGIFWERNTFAYQNKNGNSKK
jgi:site-specific DNA-methyltransferase (adenine-specific)